MAARTGKSKPTGAAARRAKGAATRAAKPDSAKATAKSLRADEDVLLHRVASMIAAHPEMEAGDALDTIGSGDLATQRRVRKEFEANREHLVAQARSSSRALPLELPRDARVTDRSSRPPREAAREEAGDWSSNGLDLGEAMRKLIRPAGDENRKIADGEHVAPLPAAVSTLSVQDAMTPMLKAGFEAARATAKVQSDLLNAWMRMPAVKMAFDQQAAFYNTLLSLASANPFLRKGR